MPLHMFQQALDFLERSGIKQARFLGGEPTLHPGFPMLVEHVMERELSLLVFSNGNMPEVALACLERITADRLSVLMNIGRPDETSPHAHTRQVEVLQRLGSRVLLGLNIDTPGVQCDFVLELIETYGLARTVRLGLAHPVVNGENHVLRPKYYPGVGQRILEFVGQARTIAIKVEFDCGFVPCMFSPEGLELLGDSVNELGTRCNPILDILPDGQVISCYPLAALHQERLPEFETASWLRKQFETRLTPYRSLGIFKECSGCEFRQNGMCAGGCLAAAMQRLRHDAFRWVRPQSPVSDSLPAAGTYRINDRPDQSLEEQERAAKWVIPYVDQPLSFWKQLADNYGQHIKEVYVPLPGRILGSGRPAQSTEFLDQLLRHSPFAISALINPIVLPGPIDELAPRIVEAVKKLTDECDLAEMTVSDLLLAEHLHAIFPKIPLTASVLMDISHPNQVLMLRDIFHNLVPASRIMRNLQALKVLKEAFPGKIRLIVNEACLSHCPFRVQHFYEMGSQIGHPHALCQNLLQHFPWMRLTGAWVLPQHLHFYDGVYDELKLAGRVTLRDPDAYRKVLEAYIYRTPLFPNEIGGGPASILTPIAISENFFAQTLACGQRCHACSVCQEYWRLMEGDFS